MTEVWTRGYPGMKSVKDLPVVQDGPPPGGFPSIRYARKIPDTGPTGTALFGVAALVMGYGFYRMINNNYKRRADHTEIRNARIALVPVLQAEEDRKYIKAVEAQREYEARIMKDVPGWKVGESVYRTRWMPPAPTLLSWIKHDDYPRA